MATRRKPATPRKPLRKFRRFLELERLEDRTLLSISLTGTPDWEDQGPGPILNGSVQVPVNNPDVGAVESIGVVPGQPDIVFVGTTNGGVWETQEATKPGSLPDWKPLTDQMADLSIGSVAVSPVDSGGKFVDQNTDLNKLVIYAGTGTFSSAGGQGAAMGVLKSSDGGAHWTLLGTETFTSEPLGIRSVLPTKIFTAQGQLVFAATPNITATAPTEGGLYDSFDGGKTWNRLSGTGILPNVGCSEVVADPGDPTVFYAAFPQNGVFKLTASGAINAENITSNLGALLPAGTAMANTGRIRLAASPLELNAGKGNRALYASVFVPVTAGNPFFQNLAGVFQFDPLAKTWKAIPGFPANPIGSLHASMAADPTNVNQVYIGGFGAILSVGDATTNNWTPIFGAPVMNPTTGAVIAGANNTTPHRDSRNLIFASDGSLLEADDGGIYRMSNPQVAATRVWTSLNGDLRNTEFRMIAYDRLNHDIIGGAQDDGSAEQRAGSLPGFQWTQASDLSGNSARVGGGDGNFQAVDNSNSNQSIRYSIQNNFNFFTRRIFNNQDRQTDESRVLLQRAPGAGFGTGLNDLDRALSLQQAVNIPMALNNVFPNRMMMLGSNGLYESILPASIPPPPAQQPPPLGDVIIDRTQSGMGQIHAIAYGGRDISNLASPDAPDVAYVGAGSNLFLRLPGSTSFQLLTKYTDAHGTDVRSIVMDPENWHTVYVIDVLSVFRGTQVGTKDEKWVEITGNLNDLLQVTQIGSRRVPDLRSLEFVRTRGHDVLLAGGFGGVYRLIDADRADATTSGWSAFGAGLPNVVVSSVHFDAKDDVLVAGTLGRGAWKINNVAADLIQSSILTINFDVIQDVIKLQRDPNNPLLLDVLDTAPGKTPQQFQLSDFEQIIVNGLGGTDSLIIDNGNGVIKLPEGIVFNGGGGQSELQIDGDIGKQLLIIKPTDPADPLSQHSGEGRLFSAGPVARIAYNDVGHRTNNLQLGVKTPPSLVAAGLASIASWSGHFADPTLLGQNLPVLGRSLGDALEGRLVAQRFEQPVDPDGGGGQRRLLTQAATQAVPSSGG